MSYKLEQQKIEFIKTLPKYKSISPFIDQTSVQEVKRALVDAGFYKIRYWQTLDSAVINLILIAQGKKRFIHSRLHRNRRK